MKYYDKNGNIHDNFVLAALEDASIQLDELAEKQYQFIWSDIASIHFDHDLKAFTIKVNDERKSPVEKIIIRQGNGADDFIINLNDQTPSPDLDVKVEEDPSSELNRD